MKAKNVPFASVSVDSDIQGKKEQECKLEVQSDGTIASVPKACVSGGGVNSLILEMRYGTTLWAEKFIRLMSGFYFEQELFGWGKRVIEMNRENTAEISILWKNENGMIKRVKFDEEMWNVFISNLFNRIKVDTWSVDGVYSNNKKYLSDGRPYRSIPDYDGGKWLIKITGDGRNHEFSGEHRVPLNWKEFIDFINKIEEIIDLADEGEFISIY